MAYSCYVRSEGRGIVEVEPTVTIRFDKLTAVTRNRVRRVLQDNYCPYSWSSRPQAVLTAMQEHYKVIQYLLEPKLMNHPNFDAELFAAKALLIGYKFKVMTDISQEYWHYGYGHLTYVGGKSYDDRKLQADQMEKLKQNTLLPIARSLIDHTKLAPIMDALENRLPYTFAGINMK